MHIKQRKAGTISPCLEAKTSREQLKSYISRPESFHVNHISHHCFRPNDPAPSVKVARLIVQISEINRNCGRRVEDQMPGKETEEEERCLLGEEKGKSGGRSARWVTFQSLLTQPFLVTKDRRRTSCHLDNHFKTDRHVIVFQDEEKPLFFKNQIILLMSGVQHGPPVLLWINSALYF